MSEPSRAELGRALADAVDRVPGVVARSAGTDVEVATQVPGDKIIGIRLGDDAVTIHVIVDRFPIPDVAYAVRAAGEGVLRRVGDERVVVVVVDDIVLPGEATVAGPDGGRTR